MPTKEDKPETNDDISERLKKSLEELQFPLEYNEQQVTGGHPAYFSKIIHHILFGYDKRIQDYLLRRGIDSKVVNLSDWKFMERVLYINVSP